MLALFLSCVALLWIAGIGVGGEVGDGMGDGERYYLVGWKWCPR